VSGKLSRRQRRLVLRVSELLLPGAEQGFPTLDELGFVALTEHYLGDLHPLHRQGLVRVFDVLNALPLGMGFARPLVRLRDADARRFLHRLERSRVYALRNMLTLTKALVMLVYYADPRIEARLGYTDGCLVPGQAG
jgi:hypothetical protein